MFDTGRIELTTMEARRFNQLQPVEGEAIKFWNEILISRRMRPLDDGVVYSFTRLNSRYATFSYRVTDDLQLKRRPDANGEVTPMARETEQGGLDKLKTPYGRKNAGRKVRV